MANVRGLWQAVELSGAKLLEERFRTYDANRDAAAAAAVNQAGKGSIAAVFGPIGFAFAETHAPATREFLARIVDRLYSRILDLDAPPTVEPVLRKKDGKLMLHVLNSTNMQVASSYAAVDFIPPVGPIGIKLRLPSEPRGTTLAPGGVPLAGHWLSGVWSATIDKLDIHSTVVFEF
jgi:hypothetical protein